MASLSLQKGNRPGYRLMFYSLEKRKCSIWLGPIPEADALEWKKHVEHLLHDVLKHGDLPSKATSHWLRSLPDSEYEKLSKQGLVESREKLKSAKLTLWDWCETYIAERSDIKSSTKLTFEKTRDSLIAHFGKKKLLREIRPEDAKRWRIWMLTQGNRRDKETKAMEEATVRRRCGIVKQFFKEAVERKLIESNPFAKLVSTSMANSKRQFFVTREMIDACIEKCPDDEWKLILALTRFGGLRCPSELTRLEWRDVDLPNGRMIIHASKTEHHSTGGVRVCPIFPELRPFLEKAWTPQTANAT